jgi:competence protein ComEA
VDLHALSPAHRRLLTIAVACAALLVLVVPRVVHRGAPHAVVPPLRAPRAPAHVQLLVVDVAGAVRRPGLYRLPRGTRIADAIARAGGLTAKAERAAVNLAAPLADGEQVLVPARGSASVSAGGTAAGPLDLNTATLEQLDGLPGIGPTTAQKILDYRQEHGPFHSLAELDAVPGIGQGRIEQLKGLVIP